MIIIDEYPIAPTPETADYISRRTNEDFRKMFECEPAPGRDLQKEIAHLDKIIDSPSQGRKRSKIFQLLMVHWPNEGRPHILKELDRYGL
jgi:hypothetical protein